MEIKDGAVLHGLQPCMRPVLRAAERIWSDLGRAEGVTVTCGLDGTHSASSWHYYGLALDFRTNYFTPEEAYSAFVQLKASLPEYDIVLHSTHIHAEIGNVLAKKLDVFY